MTTSADETSMDHAARRVAVRNLRVAAVQMPSRLGAIEENLAHAEPLADEAAAQGAALVLFPELMPSGYAWDVRAWSGAEPPHGPTSAWLQTTAARLGIWIGTSFLEAAGEDFWNTFLLVGPDGSEAGRVRKEFPALYEARTFRGASGSHVIDSELGRIGVGICFDAHTAAVARKFASTRVDLVLAPHCYCVPAQTSRMAGLDAATTAAIVDDYEQAQLRSLKAGLLAAALLALVSLAFTGGLPGNVPVGTLAPDDDAAAPDKVASAAAS